MSPGGPLVPPTSPQSADAEGIALLGAAFERASYSPSKVAETLDLEGPFSRDPFELPVYLRMLPEDDSFSTLAKLFLLGGTLPPEEVERAVAPLDTRRLEAMGIVERSERGVAATVEIMPWDDFLIMSDPLSGDLPPSRADHVLGIHPPSIVLAELTVRRPSRATLDLGTGSGVQALLAARHSQRVVGVDLNPRALDFGRFNALLNGLPQIELREGSMLDPVEDGPFGLVVSNPPYVISPESQYIFRDTDLPADSFCRELVRRMPELLEEGGFGHLLVGWVHREDQPWDDPLRRWVEGIGCDAIAFHSVSQNPLNYASTWNRPLRWDPVAYSLAIDRWLEYDREHGIEAIGWGALALRKRSGGENWFLAHQLDRQGFDAAGDHILRMFAAQDFLAGPARDHLLDVPYRLADDHVLDQSLVVRDRTGLIRHAALRLEGGFRFEIKLDRQAMQLVSQLDGRPAREVVDQIAEATEQPARYEFLANVGGFLRKLVELGVVVPVERDGP
jgi:hypothetical protein